MLNDLKRRVCQANQTLHARYGIPFTWGSVSGFDAQMGLFVVRPKGIPFAELQPEHMVVVSMEGQKVEGRFDPTRESETHRAVYMHWAMNNVGSVLITPVGVPAAYAAAGLSIPLVCAVFAEQFAGDIPCSAPVDVAVPDYEYQLGELCVRTSHDPARIPAALVQGHGAVVWGKTPSEALVNFAVLEELAQTAFSAQILSPTLPPMPPELIQRRWDRHNCD